MEDSDYTGSIFGAALNAEEIEIWTDVDGMMTARPTQSEKCFYHPDYHVCGGNGIDAFWRRK